MKTRVITASIMVAAVVMVLLSNVEVLTTAAAVVALWAAYEIVSAFGYNKKDTVLAGIYIMISALITAILSADTIGKHIDNTYIGAGLFLYVSLGFFMVILCHEKIRVKDFISALGICVISVWFFMYAVDIRTEFVNGKFLIWSVLVGACFTDTFALFAGKFFGRRKLIPKVSPNKTVEGAVGGIAGSVIMMLVYAKIISVIGGFTVNYTAFALLGFISALFAQVGDLSYSALKREAGLKDFGNIFPGHGGILDRIDSIIFVAPVAYFFLSFVQCIG